MALVDSTFRRQFLAATLVLTLEGQLSTAVGIRLSNDFGYRRVFAFGQERSGMAGIYLLFGVVLITQYRDPAPPSSVPLHKHRQAYLAECATVEGGSIMPTQIYRDGDDGACLP